MKPSEYSDFKEGYLLAMPEDISRPMPHAIHSLVTVIDWVNEI